LAEHRHALRRRFWEQAGDAGEGSRVRFRALVALAAFDPEGEGWEAHGPAAVEHLLEANALHLGPWTEALRPVHEALLRPLGEVFRTAKSPDRRERAARLLADYAADKPDLLADLLPDADAKQYALLRPVLDRYRELTVERMRREVQGEEF